MIKNYPKQYKHTSELMEKLSRKAPDAMGDFMNLHEHVINEGILNTKIKELIALGIAITVRCDGCIAYHVHDAIEAGATPDEITETIGVAILMGGGPSVVYGCEAFEALEQFTSVAASV